MSVATRLRRGLIALGLLGGSGDALAAELDPDAINGGFELTRHTIDTGGGRSAGGGFSVVVTIGQPDADPLHPVTGGPFSVIGGFLPMANAPPSDSVFRDGFEGL